MRTLVTILIVTTLLGSVRGSHAEPAVVWRYHLHIIDGEILGVLTDRAYVGQPPECQHGDPDLRNRLYRTLLRRPLIVLKTDGSMTLQLGDQPAIPAREARTLSSGARGGFWDSSTPGIETAFAVSPRGRAPNPRVDVTIMRATPDGTCFERWIGLGHVDGD